MFSVPVVVFIDHLLLAVTQKEAGSALSTLLRYFGNNAFAREFCMAVASWLRCLVAVAFTLLIAKAEAPTTQRLTHLNNHALVFFFSRLAM